MSDLVFLGFGTFLFILTAALREPAGVFEGAQHVRTPHRLGCRYRLGIYRDGSRLWTGSLRLQAGSRDRRHHAHRARNRLCRLEAMSSSSRTQITPQCWMKPPLASLAPLALRLVTTSETKPP